MGGRRKYHPGFSVICSYGVLACISGSAENHTSLQWWVQGCLSCGIKVGINSFYIGCGSFYRALALLVWVTGFGIWDLEAAFSFTGDRHCSALLI
jgi:hypothetical protein